ncbi:MAG: hypothetical protein O9325_04630 [Roseomonas sp.]|nr:hypothetical protein [Roseomonas sp.]
MPETAPRALVVSLVAGRMRLRLPGPRDDAAFFALLAQRALMLPGVLGVSANPTTAGLLLRFRGAAEALLAAAAKDGLFRATPPAPAARNPSAAQLAPLGAAAFGFLAALQAARGAVLPPATSLLWYAGNLLRGSPSAAPEE